MRRHAAFLAFALVRLTSGQQPVQGTLVFVAGGDMIGPYRSFQGVEDAGFRQISRLFQQGRVSFANQEGSLFDLQSFPGYPSAENGGGYPVAPAIVAQDLRNFGITLVSKANNHATDWGAEGLVATLKSLAAAGIVQAGSGLSDAQARAPAYIDTPNGRAALVSTASTFPPAAVAGPAVERRGLISRPRPGISALRVRQIRLISASQLATLRQIAGPIGFPAGANGEELRIGDQYFRASSNDGTTIEADPEDKKAVLAAIREAHARAQFVVFAIHAHETAGNTDDMPPVDFEPMILHRANEAPSPDDPEPASFEAALFHDAIDAGADVIVRTGPHVLNGIEVYKGKPIFYGLGSLFLAFGGRRDYTAPSGQKKSFPPEWFETAIPVSTFRDGRLKEIKLYPAVIESSSAATDGLPHPATHKQARAILERVKTFSARFGTEVSIEGDIGAIHPR
jgi:poly-gamma-glutamate capsule biosynthesis protein CapA/YwtB (metallophosphatase superfamily)